MPSPTAAPARATNDPSVMNSALAGAFGAQLKALRERAGYTQEELATIAGLSVHGVSALERGERRRPHVKRCGRCRPHWT
jgi:DNA-binding XRE family transcriptional regulator